MICILSIFEGKDRKRARIEAEIVERSERFRASPTVTIGSVTVINPIYEGPNPFQSLELLDPENEGVLIAPVESRPDPQMAERCAQKRRSRAKSEAYTKVTWFEDEGRRQQNADVARNPRYSAPPMTTVPSETVYVFDEDPFRKAPLNPSSSGPSSFFMDLEQETWKTPRRRWTT